MQKALIVCLLTGTCEYGLNLLALKKPNQLNMSRKTSLLPVLSASLHMNTRTQLGRTQSFITTVVACSSYLLKEESHRQQGLFLQLKN